MKLRLSILLFAAALAAAPAAGQTIKSLGYNTTNGVVPTTALSNLPLTFTNLGGIVGVNFSSGNVLVNSNTVTFYGTNSGLAFSAGANASQIRNQIGLGATNNVTFSNITASGTLGVTGNVTLSGSDNLMPNATNAASASSLMTRDLSDDRYTTYVWLTGSSDNQTITNGGFKFLGPSRINSFSLGYGASIPAGYTKFRVLLNFGWLTDPATNSSNFQVFVRFNNAASLSGNPFETESGTVAGTTGLYPTNSPTNGLVGTLTRIGVLNTTNSVYSFRSEYETIPAAWQSNALSNGFYHLIGVALRNNSGGSLTDGYNAGHAPVGIIEFRK
jgi:hypothetical protein